MTRFVASRPSHAWANWVERRSGWLILAGLLGAALFAFTLNLGTVPLRDWDEGLVAQVAREIAQAPADQPNWLFPTLWGRPYFNKPPLVHNLVALAYQFGGVNEWTARIPGALLTALSIPLLYGIGRELFVKRLPALFAALVLLVTLPVLRHGRLAMLDGAVLCFFLLMLFCLLRSRRNPRWSVGVGLGLSGLFLSKGIVGVLLGGMAFIFVLLDSPRLLSSVYPWAGVLLGAAPSIFWYAAQEIHYGHEFWAVHLLNQSLDRVTESVEDNSGPVWYYLLELLKYGFPWLAFVPMGLHTAWSDRNRSWARLVWIWLSVYLIVISLMSTKLPWYVLPLYPALALVVGQELTRFWDTLDGRSPKLLPSLAYRLTLAGFFAVVAVGGWVGAIHFSRANPAAPMLMLSLAAVGLTMALAATLLVMRDRQFIPLLLWGFYVSLLLFVSSNYWVWELGEDYPVKPVAALIRESVPPGSQVFTSHPLNRPSLNFYGEHQVLPARNPQLRQRWRREPDPYLLLDPRTLARLNLKHVETLGSAEGWTLITRSTARSSR